MASSKLVILSTTSLNQGLMEMSLRQIIFLLMKFAVANSHCSFTGRNAAIRTLNMALYDLVELFLFEMVPAVINGTKIITRLHHIT